jgi:ligand-binding sensor domain-containing protein
VKKLFLLTIFFSSLALAQNPEWIIYNTSNSLIPSNSVDNIVVDELNRKWISFWYYGLLLIENENWTIYDTTNSDIPANILSSINVDNNMNLWAGGYNDIGNFRLTKFDGNNWTIWNSSNSPIPKDDIMSIVFDNQDDLWLLCADSDYPSGTNYVLELTQDSTWTIHTSFTAFRGLRQMLFDNNQILWIGDWQGLYRYDGDTLIYLSGHPGQYCTDIKQDSVGNIWIATGLAGWGCLVKYDGISFTSYPAIRAISIEVDTLGVLWVGTESDAHQAELIKYDGNNWISYNSINSQLPSTYRIFDLAIDNFGNLWIATEESGLVVFNENGIVVPVALMNFGLDLVANDVHLNWTTSTETNNSGFEIERKESGVRSQESEWNDIGFVPGHGTTTDPQFYSFTDETIQPGDYQYRLKQTDYDGSFEYSKIVEVTIESPQEFSLSQNYPNPFNPTTKIKYTIPYVETHRDASLLVTLKVYDVLGNEVATLVNEEKPAGKYEVEFNAVNKPSGIYFYQLKTEDLVQTRKMILLK